MEDAPIYRPADLEKVLRQGEIITDIRRYRVEPASLGGDPMLIEVHYPFTVIVTQDCDVTQQGRPMPGSDPVLPCVLLVEVATADQIRDKEGINTAAWKTIRQNREERYHFLESIPIECDVLGKGLAELAIDFKRYLAVPTDELYVLIDSGRATRRCVLNSLYMEHLCDRFGSYLGRVALPRLHHSVPVDPK